VTGALHCYCIKIEWDWLDVSMYYQYTKEEEQKEIVYCIGECGYLDPKVSEMKDVDAIIILNSHKHRT
jgi:hypothetical protein